jgi:hypothetical protein
MVAALDSAASNISKNKRPKKLVYTSHQSNEDEIQVGEYAVIKKQILFKYCLIL